MSRQLHATPVPPNVRAIMDEVDQDNPIEAVRVKARAVVRDFYGVFHEEPPFNLEAVASYRGLHSSRETPKHSLDSEIVPRRDGRVALRVNRDRPITRQRFSIGHEIGHTLFPDFTLKTQCRRAIDRDWADTSDVIEMLCDVAAAEFVFPAPWFPTRLKQLTLSADALSQLATAYLASREATIRRLVELWTNPLLAVFFSWKLKPTEMRQRRRDRNQSRMFGDGPPLPVPKLRVDYGVINTAFSRRYTDHIPQDKSVPSEGPIYDASVSQSSHDGEAWLDLGTISGRFTVHALPIYTPEELLGPDGAVSVVAVLGPI
jgi:hypothetical protein